MAKKTTRKTVRKTTKKTTRAAAPRGKKVAKKTATRAAPAAKPTRIVSATKPRTKTEIFGIIAEHVGISKKEVAAVFETMTSIIAADLKKGKAEQFTVPGLMKIVSQRKPATRAHTKPDPFNKGQMMQVKAKPARNVVKVRPMKGLKDLV